MRPSRRFVGRRQVVYCLLVGFSDDRQLVVLLAARARQLPRKRGSAVIKPQLPSLSPVQQIAMKRTIMTPAANSTGKQH
jgi:hypothetical protein